MSEEEFFSSFAPLYGETPEDFDIFKNYFELTHN
jgi:hypothetical protein